MNMYDRLFKDEPSLQRLIKGKSKYTSSLEQDIHLLRTEIKRGLRMHEITLNFLSPNNTAGILLQNFIQQYLKLPSFKNNIVIENTTNDSIEAVKTILSQTPFQLLVIESPYPLFDYLIEISLDQYKEIKYNRLCGFHVNCEVSTNSAIAAVMDNYFTPFIIENDEVKILKKHPILKYFVYQYIEKESKSRRLNTVFISGEPNHITKKLIQSLVDELHLTQSVSEIEEMFENNHILARNQKRETFLNSFLTSCVYDNQRDSLIKMIFPFFFTVNKDKQKEFILDVVDHSIRLLKIAIEECVLAFNAKETTHDHIFSEANDHVNKQLRLLKKPPIKNKFATYYIDPTYNNIFRFIAINNNVEYGSGLLYIERDHLLSYDSCFLKLDELHSLIRENINSFFENELSSFLNEMDFL